MMVITTAVVVTPVGLRADCSARRRTDNRTNRGAATAADSSSDTGTNSRADKRAADGILRVGSAGHRRERRQSRKSEKGLPHGILQPYGFARQRRTTR
jgi:hypothetical protein